MRHLSRRRPLWGTALLLCSFLARSEGMVVFQTNNITLDFPSLPADFGPHIPPEGVSGLLLPADPEDACSELAPPKKGAAPWVALIARSQHKDGCTFDVKVAHAEAAGAVAAVIYDDVYEPLILMAKDPRHPDPAIPSAFVTQKSGILMRRLLVQGDTVVTLTPLSEALWLSMVMSAAAGFLAVNVVLGALWVIRRQHGGATLAGVGAGASSRPAPPAGLTAAQIRALPIVVYGEGVAEAARLDGSGSQAGGGASVWDRRGGGSASASTPAGLEEGGEEDGEAQQLRGGSDSGSDAGARGGGTRRVCAICLEGYAGGDKLRVLPCQHRYHSGCIDQWLSGRRPLCPVCKADAHPPPAAVHSEDEDEEEEGEGEGPPSHAAADLESGRAAAAAAAQARRRRRRRRGAAARLLGQLGGGWAALRRTLLGPPPAADAGVAVVDGGGEAAEQRQQLLAGSRNSSPLPAGSPAAAVAAAASQQPESAATLTNFPAFFPTSMSASGGRRSPAPEIVPEEDAAAGGAVAADAASGSAASPTSSARGGGPCSHLVTVQPDSTEGSETESELE